MHFFKIASLTLASGIIKVFKYISTTTKNNKKKKNVMLYLFKY